MPCHADVSPDLLKVKQEIFLIYNRDNNSDDFPFYHNQDPKLRDMTMMGSQDVPLEDKMVTIVYGIDMVNVQFINFAAISKDVAKVCMVMKLKP